MLRGISIETGAAAGLDSLPYPLSRCLDAEQVRRLVEFRVELSVQECIDHLGERANEDKLNADKRTDTMLQR